MKDILIRPIAPGDNAIVAQIIRQVMTEYDCVGPGYSIEDPEVDHMYEAYNRDRAIFYVLSVNSEVIGCGGLAPLAGGDGNTCELQKMYFLPSARGLGQGKRMVQLCLDQARQFGYRRMYLETVNRMVTANALYNKFGFQKISCQEGATGHSSCDTFYELQL